MAGVQRARANEARSCRFFLTTSKDMTARLYTLYPVDGYRPKTFSGHRDAVLNAYFSTDHKTVRSALAPTAFAFLTPPADLYRLARWSRLHLASESRR